MIEVVSIRGLRQRLLEERSFECCFYRIPINISRGRELSVAIVGQVGHRLGPLV